MMDKPFLYPNVTSIPGQGGVGPADRLQRPKQEGEVSDFDRALDRALEKPAGQPAGGVSGLSGTGADLGQIKTPLKFSSHATQRLQERKIKLGPETLMKVNDALDKASAKGVEDTLVLTPEAALIVSVKNRTVITAIDRAGLTGNVFTNIDGAVII